MLQFQQPTQFQYSQNQSYSNPKYSEQNSFKCKSIKKSKKNFKNRNQKENKFNPISNYNELTKFQTSLKQEKQNQVEIGGYSTPMYLKNNENVNESIMRENSILSFDSKLMQQQELMAYNLQDNEYSIVKLSFDTSLNKFIVTKNYKGYQKQLFQKEINILKQLKDTNVTLDIIEIDNSNKFQQVAGKTNLYELKQKYSDDLIFELYFLILLDKLNKMHEKGIAHSDIKPQNIVISYENEPYYIDFGASIYLSNKDEYQKYLYFLTRRYNLKQYLGVNKFNNKKKIKLCDKTQLSLTFLRLFCNDEKQQQLFKKKEYNELIKNLYDVNIDKKTLHIKNRILVLSIISRILNEADKSINIIDNKKELGYFFDEEHIQKVLQRSNDIVFENEIFKVKSINQFNVKLIHFLDKMGCKLEITPNKTLITFLDKIQEFQELRDKYKINEYYQSLINAKDVLNEHDFYNILEYLQYTDEKIIKQKIQLQWLKKFQYPKFIFQKISKLKSINELELTIEFPSYDLYNFICDLKDNQTSFLLAENFQLFEQRIFCLIVKDPKQNQQRNIQVQYHISTQKEDDFYKKIKTIQHNYEIDKLEFLYKSLYSYKDMIDNDYDIQNNFQKGIKKMNTSYAKLQSFLFERSLFVSNQNQRTQKMKEYQEDLISKKINFYNKCQKHKIENLNYLIKNIYKQQQQSQSYIDCDECKQIITLIKQDISVQVEQFTCKILQIDEPNFKIVIKINNYIFEQIETWQKIVSNIKVNKYNCYFKLILINCKLSDEIIEYIQKNYDYQEKNKEQDESDHDFLKYQIYVKQKKIKDQKGLNIIKINKFQTKQSESNIKQQQQTIMNDEQNTQTESDKDSSQTINNEIQIEQNKTIAQIQQIFKQEEQQQIQNLKEMCINYKSYLYDIYFYFEYKNKECNEQNINKLIKDINNKQIYQIIYLSSQVNSISLNLESQDIVMKYDYQDSEIYKLFQKLLFSIYENYYKKKDNYNLYYQLLNKSIKLEIVYQDYSVVEDIYKTNLDSSNIQEILDFFKIDKNQYFNDGTSYTEKNMLFLSQFCIEISLNLIKPDDLNNKINEIKMNLKDKLNNLQKNSIVNQEETSIFFQNKLPLLQLLQFTFNKNKKNYNKILFEEIENSYAQNIMYTFYYFDAQILEDIYDVITTSQQQHKLYIDLSNCYIYYSDFEQFANKINEDNSNNQFIFQIQNINNQMKSEMKDTPEFKQKQAHSLDKLSKTIQIYFILLLVDQKDKHLNSIKN